MMHEVMIEIFGQYQPIEGCADWSYIGGVVLLCITVSLALYALCGVLKR